MATQRELFIQKIAPYAQKYAPMVNLPPSVVIAQLGIESADGTSNPAKGYNNYGGIMYTKYADFKGKQSTQGTYFAGYNSIDSFFKDYVRVLSLGMYSNVRSSGTVEETVRALAASPYDAGHYGGTGSSILAYINVNNLRQYDSNNNNKSINVNPSDVQQIKGVSGAVVVVVGATALAIAALLNN